MNLANERIVITGGAGFLGRYLWEQLAALGAAGERLLVPLHSDYDLTNESDVARMYRDLAPSVVIHLAAEVGGIGANRAAAGRFFYANMAMGMHLIEHARLAKVKKFVQIGTVCAYPKFTPIPFTEDNLWSGYPEETNAPYGLAKRSLLVMLQAYRAQYGLNGIYLLPVNLYGPDDNFSLDTGHVIPAMIRKFCGAVETGADEVVLWGTGRCSREFLYVEDAARGIALAAQQYDEPAPVNLGAGFEITIRDLAEKIASASGFKGRIVWDSSYPDGQPRRCLNTDLAREKFGFAARMDFDEGLRRTIAWWRASQSVPAGAAQT